MPLVTTTGTPNATVWNYVYSTRAPGAGCEVDLEATNVVVDIPLYVTRRPLPTGTNVAIDERGEGQAPARAADRPARRRQARPDRHNATVGVVERLHHERRRRGRLLDVDQRLDADVRATAVQLVRDDGEHLPGAHRPTADYARSSRTSTRSTRAAVPSRRRLRRPQPARRRASIPTRSLDADAGTINLTRTRATRAARPSTERRRHGRRRALVERLDDVLTIKGAIWSTARTSRSTTRTPPTRARRRSRRTALSR